MGVNEGVAHAVGAAPYPLAVGMYARSPVPSAQNMRNRFDAVRPAGPTGAVAITRPAHAEPSGVSVLVSTFPAPKSSAEEMTQPVTPFTVACVASSDAPVAEKPGAYSEPMVSAPVREDTYRYTVPAGSAPKFCSVKEP